MNDYYTILTKQGIDLIVKSRVSKVPIELSEIAVGDGEGLPSEDMKALKNEKHRFKINTITQDEQNPSYLIIEGVLPSSVGGFYVSEVGIFDKENRLFAIGNMAKTYKPLLSEGSAKDIVFKIVIEVSNASEVTLKVDESVVLATREWVKTTFLTKQSASEVYETKKYNDEFYLKKVDASNTYATKKGLKDVEIKADNAQKTAESIKIKAENLDIKTQFRDIVTGTKTIRKKRDKSKNSPMITITITTNAKQQRTLVNNIPTGDWQTISTWETRNGNNNNNGNNNTK
ncbi:phage tail-collar fiber protein (DUF3751 domain) [Campylobacter blaseri]|uniref:Phage tail fibre protein N-terminal domain-containing protein n=1 Tax=Campylobacter blaseri TaxID=2042961 RepID=A0A2P8QYP4_9BACT|nr:phage tail protein [Campylobacter blaseri]PSM51365.1 hypothetical protein CQ405_08220 [Campylobacter blaseri]PSM52815.1 hypothetical protein CRN67_08225 [Campylobacter blaseri]QKF86116.1 phage tail-collar fiber protein (DUF3751 domain) [Campylobacter blaseri]